jgi:hypothetical protein
MVNIHPQKIITVQEVLLNLQKMKLGKAPGPDGIPARILKEFANILCRPLCAIFNSSLREGYIPTLWKEAYITPIPKSSPPTSIEQD